MPASTATPKRPVGSRSPSSGQGSANGSGGSNGSRPAPEAHSGAQERRLLNALHAFRRGDFSVRLPASGTGIDADIARAFNDCLETKMRLLNEIKRVSRTIARDGKLSNRAVLDDVGGDWQQHIEAYNALIQSVAAPMAETSRVIAAVAQGDLSQRSSLDIEGRPLRGDFLRSARVINTMVDQLNAFASEVTRVAREVGSEGKLGGQASVKGVAGMWKDLTDSVNTMAGNLTNQVRNIADVTTAVAKGDLSRKIAVEARGEILELKNTINTMVDQLNSFAGEVTRVAREVGSEGGEERCSGGFQHPHMAISRLRTAGDHRHARDL